MFLCETEADACWVCGDELGDDHDYGCCARCCGIKHGGPGASAKLAPPESWQWEAPAPRVTEVTYVSLASFRHRVFKRYEPGPDDLIPCPERYGAGSQRRVNEMKGPYKVLKLPEDRGELVDEWGRSLAVSEAHALYTARFHGGVR